MTLLDGFWWLSTPRATFGAEVKGGIVTECPMDAYQGQPFTKVLTELVAGPGEFRCARI